MYNIIIHLLAAYIHGYILMFVAANGRYYIQYRRWTRKSLLGSLIVSLTSYVGVASLILGLADIVEIEGDEGVASK